MDNTTFNIKEYIDSGVLELYVAGVLSEKENQEIANIVAQHKEIELEVVTIESKIIKLTQLTSPVTSTNTFSKITTQINEPGVIQLDTSKTNWLAYSGWAASIILAIGFIYQFNQNNILENSVIETTIVNQELEDQLNDIQKIETILRNQNFTTVALNPQNNFNAHAKVYWDKNQQKVHLDIKGLPEPPEGKVYQVWSLTLDPLTPTSIAVLDRSGENNSKIYTIDNPNVSEAFGITLEPEGGSASPTMNQLHVLGIAKT